MDKPQYINWIVKEYGVVFEDQQPLNCYKLSYEIDDDILDDWALHIRRHYVPDDEFCFAQINCRGILAPIRHSAKGRAIWSNCTFE